MDWSALGARIFFGPRPAPVDVAATTVTPQAGRTMHRAGTFEAPSAKASPSRPTFDPVAAAFVRQIAGTLNPLSKGYVQAIEGAAVAAGVPVIDLAFVRTQLAALVAQPSFKNQVAGYVARGNSEIFEQLRAADRRDNRVGQASDEARWRDGLAASTMERIQRDLFGPQAVSTALRYRATDNPTLEGAWRQSLVETLHSVRGTTGETRQAIVASLAEDLGRLFPASFFEADLRALAAGHDDAIADMALDVQLSGYRDITPTVGKGAPAGVLSIAMPSLSEPSILRLSGDNHMHVTMRNFGSGGGVGLGEYLREAAGRKAGQPMRYLELTQGVPMSALMMSDAENFRILGDYLIYDGQRHEAPKLSATVIGGRDMTRELIAGHLPQVVTKWFGQDINGHLRVPFALRGEAESAARLAGDQALRDAGRFTVHCGDTVDTLRELVAKGERFDVATYHELALTADRIRALEALQNALTDGGMAFVPTRTWSPVAIGEAAGTEDLKTVLDTVKTAHGEVALGEFLAANYPHAFEYRHGTGVSAIVVKGTKDPVKLAAMDAQDTGATTERGLPILRWHEV